MAAIQEYNCIGELAELRPAWEALLELTPNASFFQSLDWLETQWRHLGAKRKLRVIVTREHGQITGILPLNVRFGKPYFGSPATLSFPFENWGSFFDPIGPEPFATFVTAMDYIRRAPRDYDVIELSPLRLTGEQLSSLDNHCVTPCASVGLIDLNTTWAEYWESRRKDHNRRRNVERCERRLAEQGTLTYVRYRPAGALHSDAQPRWDLYDACEGLARKSWQSGLDDGNTLSHPRVSRFLRDVHVAAANAGCLDLNLLCLNDRPIAFLYGYHYRGTVELIRTGFDPDLAAMAPGNALWTRVIRDSFERCDRTIDLGPTCLDYKRFWITRVESTYQYRMYPWHPRCQLLRAAFWLRSQFERKRSETNEASKRAVAGRRARLGDSRNKNSDSPTRLDRRTAGNHRTEQAI